MTKYIAVQDLTHGKTGKFIKTGEPINLSHLDAEQVQVLISGKLVKAVGPLTPEQKAAAEKKAKAKATAQAKEDARIKAIADAKAKAEADAAAKDAAEKAAAITPAGKPRKVKIIKGVK